MTNTTKTLEAMKKQARLDFPRLLERYMIIEEDSNGLSNTLDGIDTFAEKIWNGALDACREKMPNETETENNGLLNDDEARGFNAARSLALSAIDSLRTVGGKE